MDDVTDLLRLGEQVRRMQLHLASIVESAGDLIISTDRAGAILTWNSAAARATGLSEFEVQGGKLADHIEAAAKTGRSKPAFAGSRRSTTAVRSSGR